MSRTTLQRLAANLRRIREARGMTQTSLAEASGIDQPRISEIERGALPPGQSVTTNTLDKLAVALGVEVSELIQEPKEVRR